LQEGVKTEISVQIPWIDGSVARTHEYSANWVAQNTVRLKNASLQEPIRSMGVGGPDNTQERYSVCRTQAFDETALPMQLYRTPHARKTCCRSL
jgi:hypothetical protein